MCLVRCYLRPNQWRLKGRWRAISMNCRSIEAEYLCIFGRRGKLTAFGKLSINFWASSSVCVCGSSVSDSWFDDSVVVVESPFPVCLLNKPLKKPGLVLAWFLPLLPLLLLAAAGAQSTLWVAIYEIITNVTIVNPMKNEIFCADCLFVAAILISSSSPTWWISIVPSRLFDAAANSKVTLLERIYLIWLFECLVVKRNV